MRCYQVLSVVLFTNIFVEIALGESNYFLKAAKNVPRIGRSNTKNTNIDEMGKFFMKASKSVPRIGRRNDIDYEQAVDKRDQAPLWSDLADKFEYEPELFSSPEVLERLEMVGDDPSAYDWDKIRVKRDSYQKHPKFQYLM